MKNTLPTLNEVDDNHQHIWSLLPWFITDSLNNDDFHDVEHHLTLCRICKKELSIQSELHDSVNELVSDNISPAKKSFAFNTVMQQISNHKHSIPQTNSSGNNDSVFGKIYYAIKNFEFGSIPYSIAASFVIAVSVSIILLQSNNVKIYSELSVTQSEPELAQTFEAANISHSQYRTRVIFNKNVSATDIQTILTRYQGTLVEGPNSRKLYTIDFFSAVKSRQQFRNLLVTLRQLPEVLYIDIINNSTRGK